MKLLIRFSGAVFILLFANSCGIFLDKNLAKRYTNHSNARVFGALGDAAQGFVKVELNSVMLTESKEKEIKYNLLSLTDKGQEAFINSANSKTAKSEDLMKVLSSNFAFSQQDKVKVKIIPKTVKKTLIFTIDREFAMRDEKDGPITFNNNGDRISYLELILKIPKDNKGIFNSWDKYVTDKVTLNLGKVTSAQNWNASLNVSAKGNAEMSLAGSNSTEDFISGKEAATVLVNTGNGSNSNTYELLSTDKASGSKSNSAKAGAELGGSATVGYSDKYETTLDLSSQILKLSGTISENKMILRQEGGPGIDLSGNIVVSVEYSLTDDWAVPVQFLKAGKLYGDSGQPNTTDAITLSYLMVFFPDIKQNIRGLLDYSFLYRQVLKGNRHIPEARQWVKYKYGTVESSDNVLIKEAGYTDGCVDLIRPQDIRPKAYFIRHTGSANDLKFNNVALRFETAFEAASFLTYIRDLSINSLPLTKFRFDSGSLTNDAIMNLQIVTLTL